MCGRLCRSEADSRNADGHLQSKAVAEGQIKVGNFTYLSFFIYDFLIIGLIEPLKSNKMRCELNV